MWRSKQRSTKALKSTTVMSALLPLAKNRAKRALSRAGVVRFVQALRPTRVVILKYHSIRNEPNRYAHSIGVGIIHSTCCFARHMECVARWYNPVTLDDVFGFMRGQQTLPRRPVVVTFDDGYRDNCDIAAPIMERFGIPGTIYVTVAAIGGERPPWFCRLRHAFGTTHQPRLALAGDDRSFNLGVPAERRDGYLAASAACAKRSGERQDRMIASVEEALGVEPLRTAELMMDWDNVRTLRRKGHTIGSHTVTHPNLAWITEAEADSELRESKRVLESQIGEPVLHLAYPNPILEPNWTSATSELAARAGYRTAVTSESGSVSARDEPLRLRRVAVPKIDNVDEFRWLVDSSLVALRP
jgi:peptidoglycan/xylan/chitin deacetylase (PgdA/CDA1 family)